MSHETDRIAVPTNGKHPRPDPAAAPVTPEPPPSQPMAPLTTTQLAVGFAIVAAIVALVAGSLRRRGRGRRRGPFGGR